ncbi:MAG: tetratricopeptide repeat protein [Candidatus Sulfotelmatobacter sp.]
MKPAETLVKGWRALELFTDRHDIIRSFTGHVNDESPHKTAIFLLGDGGTGKSLILRFFQKYCCKRFNADDWKWLRSLPDAEFVSQIRSAEGDEPVPVSFLDFGMPARGDDRPRESFSALLMIRRALTRYGLKFPLYDFACVLYLYKTNRLDPERLKTLLPAEDLDLLTETIKVLKEVPGVDLAKAVLNLFSNHLRTRFTLYLQARKLTESEVERIRRMDADTELVDALPELFAKDLNAAAQGDDAPKRIVLLFDTHEAFWGHERTLPDAPFFERDEWFRDLLLNLRLSSGIIVVVAGRDRPRWSELGEFATSEHLVEVHRVEDLSVADAQTFLVSAGINAEPMRNKLVEYCATTKGFVHPLYLAFCADIIQRATTNGNSINFDDFPALPDTQDRTNELVRQLLRYVDKEYEVAIRALSVCRLFDENVYFLLGRMLNYKTIAPSFEVITTFSFISPFDSRGGGSYRVHALLRRIFQTRKDDVVQAAHRCMEQYFRSKAKDGDFSAVADAIYHANRLEWHRGIEEWLSTFTDAWHAGKLALCELLVGIRNELNFESDVAVARVALSSSHYFSQFAKYSEAEQELRQATSILRRCLKQAPKDTGLNGSLGTALQCLGDLNAQLSKHSEAVKCYEEGILSYDVGLRSSPNSIGIRNNKGMALSSLGQLQTLQSRHEAAMRTYTKSVACFEEVLTYEPNDASVLNNKGNVYERIAQLQADRSQFDAALESCRSALSAYNKAIKLESTIVAPLHNKANVLQRIGDLYSFKSDRRSARHSYRGALAAYDKLLRRNPDMISSYVSKAAALQSLAELCMRWREKRKGIEAFFAAIETCDKALERAPDSVEALLTKGTLYQSLSSSLAESGGNKDALEFAQEAIATFTEALKLAPDFIIGRNNLGNAYLTLGDLQAAIGDHKEAINSFWNALIAFEHVFQHSPSLAITWTNRAKGLQSIAQAEAAIHNESESLRRFQESIEAYDKSLMLAPKIPGTLGSKADALYKLGVLHAQRGNHETSLSMMRLALETIKLALAEAPSHPLLLGYKASILRDLGSFNLDSENADAKAAEMSYKDSIQAHDDLLRLLPGDVQTLFNKGTVITLLGMLYMSKNQYEQAEQEWQKACAAYKETIDAYPSQARDMNLAQQAAFHHSKAQAHYLLAQSQLKMRKNTEARENLKKALAAYGEARSCDASFGNSDLTQEISRKLETFDVSKDRDS